MQTDTNKTDLITAVIIIITIVADKTLMQVCLEIDHHINLLSATFIALRKTCSSKLTLYKKKIGYNKTVDTHCTC